MVKNYPGEASCVRSFQPSATVGYLAKFLFNILSGKYWDLLFVQHLKLARGHVVQHLKWTFNILSGHALQSDDNNATQLVFDGSKGF